MYRAGVIMMLFLILFCDVKLVSTVPCDTGDLGEAINSFGLDLLKLLPGNADWNVFFSPFSISTALAMTYLGTNGTTAREMENTLKFNKCPDYHKLFKDILKEINGKNHQFTLKSANNLFPSISFQLKKSYLQNIANFYLAEIKSLNYFQSAAAEYINEWVSNKTEEKIKDIIEPGVLGPNTVLVLVNAIYFKGDWKYTFDTKNTKPVIFNAPGEKRKVDMMFQTLNETQDFVYFEDIGLDAQILELLYKGDNISMVILLPKRKASLTNLEAALNSTALKKIQLNLTNQFGTSKRKVNVKIPKLLLNWKYDIVAYLKKLGMHTLFTNGDFKKLCGCTLPVEDVIHQAFVDVNEEGTEAAAATVVSIAISIGSGPVEFTADRPFLFMIRHRPSNTILFMGRVLKPNKAKKRVSCLTSEPCMKLITNEPAPECCGCRFNFKDPSKKKPKPESPKKVLRRLKKQGRDDCLMEECLNATCLKKFG